MSFHTDWFSNQGVDIITPVASCISSRSGLNLKPQHLADMSDEKIRSMQCTAYQWWRQNLCARPECDDSDVSNHSWFAPNMIILGAGAKYDYSRIVLVLNMIILVLIIWNQCHLRCSLPANAMCQTDKDNLAQSLLHQLCNWVTHKQICSSCTEKMTVRGTIVRSEVCNAGRFCLESYS